MASLNQLADKLLNAYDQAFNHELRERLKDSYKFLRATRIRQSIEKSGIDDEFLLSFNVDLIKVTSDDDCFTPDLNCPQLRSQNKIPKPIRYKTDVPFTYVGTRDGIAFYQGHISSARYKEQLPFISEAICYVWKNGYIYLYGRTKLKRLLVEEVIANPEEAGSMCDANTECYNDDMEFPLPDDMIYSITQEIIKTEFGGIKPQDDKGVSLSQDNE